MENKLQQAGFLLEQLGQVLKEAGDEQNNLLNQIEKLDNDIQYERAKRHKMLALFEEMIKELY